MLDQMLDNVKGLFDALGITRTRWVGLSMSDMIKQTFVLKYLGVFQSLILAHTTRRRPPNSAQMCGRARAHGA